jgi:acyl-CoA synthetase (AMP-forming)/AMP-acid ligase II/thioesterase domain-containing protein
MASDNLSISLAETGIWSRCCEVKGFVIYKTNLFSRQACMFPFLTKCGSIKDLGLGLSWDSATLVHEVSRRAGVLAEMGIGRGSIVAIVHSGTARFFADLFATWSVGAAAACLDSSLTPGELKNVIEFADSAALLIDAGTSISIENLSIPVVELNPASTIAGPTLAAITLEDPALLLFTSGTTGTPKGVVLTFGALSERINANITAIGAPTLARTLVTLPTFFGHGLIGNSLTPLLAGGTIVLHPRGMPLINDLGPIIDEHHISFLSSVPSFWRLALTCGARPMSGSLLRVHVGSAPLSAALWSEIAAWADAEVVNCYGITETANWIAGASSRENQIANGLVGKMWGGRAGVMDENGSIMSEGTGEIVINSSCLMSGYYKRPDLTAAAFSQGWFRTGDQGMIDNDGRIWITGRIKDEINRGGFKVQPAEIDALLEKHQAVAEACVFGIPDPMGGEAIAAAIRLKSGKNVTSFNLQTWCSQRLRRAAVPERWFFVSEIPRTARGKVSRDNVRRRLTEYNNNYTLNSEHEPTPSGAIAIASTFFSDPLFPALRFSLREAGLALEVRSAPYHQVLQELRSATSLLAQNAEGVDVVIMRFEDFVREIEELADARDMIKQTLSSLQSALSDHTCRVTVPTVLAVLPPSPRVSKMLSLEIEAATEALFEHARSLPGLTLLSLEDIEVVGLKDRYDKIGDEFAHIPFTETYYSSIALALTRKIHALQAPADEALWRGALSDGERLLQALRATTAQPRSLLRSPAPPINDKERELLDLWNIILGVEGIGVEDDFFALGGTSLMAARLFAELTRRFAIKLPLSVILESPTVRALSHRLEEVRASPPASLVNLKTGGPRHLFFVHDGQGETLLYLNLARRMPDDLAVMGIQPRRMPHVPVAHVRIEDMAKFYIDELRRKQPRGPYLFAGMCAGGVIAYEMASQLVRAGERVELVALLDAPTPQAPKKAGRIAKRRLGRLKQVLEGSKLSQLTVAERVMNVFTTISRKLTNTLVWEINRQAKNFAVKLRFTLLRQLLSRGMAWPNFVPELSAQQILNSAQACYVPKPVTIPSILLVRAKSGEGIDTPYSKIFADASLGWDSVAKNLTVIDVDGGHSSMLQEGFVDSLANSLRPYVKPKPATAAYGH